MTRRIALYAYGETGLGTFLAEVSVPRGSVPEVVTWRGQAFLRMAGNTVRDLPIYRECVCVEGAEP